MLTVTIPSAEYFDERTGEFVQTKEKTLELEHSLVSVSKWEAKWHKPFLSGEQMTQEQMLDYIKCMTLTKNVSPIVYDGITADISKKINDYIEAPMTATTIVDRRPPHRSNEMTTSEVIYYWMISLDIPFECQKWHLNRLLTLIKVCDVKGGAQQKMSKKDIFAQNTALNAARRGKHHSRG